MWIITKYYVGLLLPIFITSVFGIDKELGCPKKDYKLRDKAYMKLEGKSGEFCISCYYTKGGPVNKYKYYNITFAIYTAP